MIARCARGFWAGSQVGLKLLVSGLRPLRGPTASRKAENSIDNIDRRRSSRRWVLWRQLGSGCSRPEDANEPVMHALRESIQQELERVFRLLGLLYPHLDLHSVHFGLQSKNATVYDNTLEFLENSQLRAIWVPLLDGKMSPKRESSNRGAFCARKSGKSRAGRRKTGRQP